MDTTLIQENTPMEGELRMGAGAVLTVFFAATLVSAVFFGLGYSFGRTGSGIHFAVPVHSANAPAPSLEPRSAVGYSLLIGTV